TRTMARVAATTSRSPTPPIPTNTLLRIVLRPPPNDDWVIDFAGCGRTAGAPRWRAWALPGPHAGDPKAALIEGRGLAPEQALLSPRAERARGARLDER